jgi:hypothetical protein
LLFVFPVDVCTRTDQGHKKVFCAHRSALATQSLP